MYKETCLMCCFYNCYNFILVVTHRFDSEITKGVNPLREKILFFTVIYETCFEQQPDCQLLPQGTNHGLQAGSALWSLWIHPTETWLA